MSAKPGTSAISFADLLAAAGMRQKRNHKGTDECRRKKRDVQARRDEEESHRRLEAALQGGNPIEIQNAQEFWLRTAETLCRLDISVELARRTQEAQVPFAFGCSASLIGLKLPYEQERWTQIKDRSKDQIKLQMIRKGDYLSA